MSDLMQPQSLSQASVENCIKSKAWVLYHANCLDGFGAAWAAWKVLGDSANYRPVHHGDPLPEIPQGQRVYILDFCYSPELLMHLAAQSESVVVLDHHISAQSTYARYLEVHPNIPANLHIHFDLGHSGCVLAWEHFHPGQPVPPLLTHIEDRDLWRHELPGTQEINRALYLRLPLAFEGVEDVRLDELEQEGRILQRQLQQSVQALFAQRHTMTVLGQCGLAVNAPAQFASDLGEALAIESGTFGLIYQFNGQRQRWECSLRSCGEFDVATLAARLGGGGHTNAAGFTLDALQMPWRGELNAPDSDHLSKALSREPGGSDQTSTPPGGLADNDRPLEQAIALAVEYQHRFDPYRGARKRAYLIAAERFGVPADRVKALHADRHAWLNSLADADLMNLLEALQTELGLSNQ